MKKLLRVCMGLFLLSGCQAATGLTELEIVRESELDPQPVAEELPVAGSPKPPKPSVGIAGSGEAGSAAAGVGGSAGAMISVAQAGVAGGAGTPASTGGAGAAGHHEDPPAPMCDLSHDAECNIFDSCGCEGRLACGVVKEGESYAVGCTDPGRAQLGSACEGISSCVPGNLCIGKPATCRKVCEVDADCGSGSACLGVSNLKGVGFCAQTCVSNTDCATDCCAPSGQGVDVCMPAVVCPGPTPTTPTTPPTGSLKLPGETCSVDADCKSKDCYEGYCYDTRTADATCSRKYDCRSGLCASEVPQASTGVCLEPVECVQKDVDTCFIALALKACQLVNKCKTEQPSLSACVSNSCVSLSKDYTLSECQSLVQSLGENPACPSSP